MSESAASWAALSPSRCGGGLKVLRFFNDMACVKSGFMSPDCSKFRRVAMTDVMLS